MSAPTEKDLSEALESLLRAGLASKQQTNVQVDDDMDFDTTIVRSPEEIGEGKAQYSRHLRSSVTLKEKLSIMKEATTGLSLKLSKIDYERLHDNSGEEQLENNVEVETFITKMKTHLLRYDMRKIFEKFPVLEPVGTSSNEADRFKNKDTINLLELWDQVGEDKPIKLSTIGDAIKWMKTFASASSSSFLEDMEWSHTFLMNSMDEGLHEAVQSTLENDYSSSEQGGPLTFAIMVDKVINLSEGAIEGMTMHLKEYKIDKTPGEDIEKICRRFRFALRRLENNGSLTKDVVGSLFKVFQTTSVEEFNAMFALWKRTIDLEGAKRPEYQTILNKAIVWYKNLKIAGEWTTLDVLKDGAAFKASEVEEIVCHHCGERGHKKPNCPQLSKERKALITEPTRSDRPISVNPLRFEKKFGDKTLKWCKHCGGRRKTGKWNATHFTDEHIFGRRSESANLADSSQATRTDDDGPGESTSMSFASALAQASARQDN